jgi:hypothetical protein
LAVKLGHVNIDRMLRSITAKQYWDWEAYASLEPFDEEWMNIRFGTIVQAIRNVLVSKEENLAELEDCVLHVEGSVEKTGSVEEKEKELRKHKQPQTFEEQIAIAKIMVDIQRQLAEEGSPDA